jgi:hypothetical protein
MNMDRLIDKINELHATIDYADYSELMDLVAELKAENEQLKARLAEAVELPCKVGDTVYVIAKCEDVVIHYDDDGDSECPFESDCTFEDCDNVNGERVFTTLLRGVWFEDGTADIFIEDLTTYYSLLDFGKKIFFTRAEAEARLKELKGE